MFVAHNFKFSSGNIKLFQCLIENLSIKGCRQNGFRFYLSKAYECHTKWEQRLEDPFLKNIKPAEYYYELQRKFKKEGKISAIDADIFINSISSKNVDTLNEELEEVLRTLRRSKETINTLPSSTHAIIRHFIQIRRYDLIFKVVSDPMNYGVFFDFYLSNLLMNNFIQEKNYMGAARVASNLMLQEDFGSILTQSLALLSCVKYSFNETNEPWVDYHPVEEPEEEVKIIVRYIRNPYFDDHFDLRNPDHTVGKTLAWLSFQLKDPALKSNASVLGWSMYEKWEKLSDALKLCLKENCQLDSSVCNLVTKNVSKCEDSEIKNHISTHLSELKSKNQISDIKFLEKCENFAVENAKKFEKESIEEQENTYDLWKEKRKECVQKQLELFERNKLISEIEEKKEDLKKREDVIFFFDNKDKLELLIEPKEDRGVEADEREQSARKRKSRVGGDDADYVPPEV